MARPPADTAGRVASPPLGERAQPVAPAGGAPVRGVFPAVALGRLRCVTPAYSAGPAARVHFGLNVRKCY